MAKHKVLHALFWFIGDDGGHRWAQRGDVIDVKGKDLERGKRYGALGDADDELPFEGTLIPLAESASDGEIAHYLDQGNIAEIVAQANEQGYSVALRERIAEQEKAGKQRSELIAGVVEVADDAGIANLAPVEITDGSGDDEIVAYLDGATPDAILAAGPSWTAALRTRAIAAEKVGQNRKDVVDGLTKQSK